jgi:hypothetical protein
MGPIIHQNNKWLKKIYVKKEYFFLIYWFIKGVFSSWLYVGVDDDDAVSWQLQVVLYQTQV